MVLFIQVLTRARTIRFPFLFLFLPCVLLGSTINSASMPSDLREVHLLNRLAFGPRPGDIERLKSIGTEQYIKEQLTPKSISLPDSLTAKLDSPFTLHIHAPGTAS